ncbi:Receptor-interacting serine/threonine-protein kinase 2 [Pleurotus pulmonarius]|nr:Receptor-interacting serine/threonine-protein kinase 2 [Pleurotus pulmonarius]
MRISFLKSNAPAKPASDITDIVKVTRYEVRRGVMAAVSLGTIRRGRFKKEKVAIKIFDGGSSMPGRRFADALKKMLEESSTTWSRVDHPNLIPFYGVAFNLAYMPALVYPFYNNGNINSYVKQRYPSESELESSDRSQTILVLMTEVARGLEYLHGFTPSIIHGDVRGASIFVNDDGHAVLCDYGLALSMPTDLPEHVFARPVGVPRWMAPEIMRTKRPKEAFGPPTGRTKKTDVYAYAMTILEVYTGLPPFGQLVTDEEGTHPLVRIDDGAVKIVMEGGRPPLSGFLQSNETLRDLVEKAWDTLPDSRPDASEIVKILETMIPKAPEPEEAPAEPEAPPRGSSKIQLAFQQLVVYPWTLVRTSFKSGYDSLRGSLR